MADGGTDISLFVAKMHKKFQNESNISRDLKPELPSIW